MKTSSAKSKGRRLQQTVRDKILELFPELTERDAVSVPMGCPGSDIMLSELASKIFPYSVECKNQEKLAIWSALEKSEQENRDLTPLLVFKRNRSKIYIAMELDVFLKVIGELYEEKRP